MKLRDNGKGVLRADAGRKLIKGLLFFLLTGLADSVAVAQGLERANRAGGTGYTVGQAIAADAANNRYVTGYYTGSSTFGPLETNQTVLTTTPSLVSDVFIAKYDSASALVWAKRAGGTETDIGFGVAVDSTGNIYVVGSFQGVATFGNGELAETTLVSFGGSDIFLAKYNSEGALVWAKQAGSSGVASADEGRSVAIDSAGNVIVAGTFTGTAAFGSGGAAISLVSAGQHDIFIAKFNSGTGEPIWARRAGGLDVDQGLSVGVDAAGNCYLTGHFRGSATFGPGQPNSTLLLTSGAEDVFVAKYDSNGVLAWVRQAGGASSDSGQSVAVDSAGNSYLAGSFTGSATFGQGTPSATVLSAVGSSVDIFVAKYDSSGTFAWAKKAGGAEADQAYSITVDGVGNNYVTGQFRGSGSFGVGGGTVTLVSEGAEDVFVAKHDADGAFRWVTRAGGDGVETGRGIVVNGSPKRILVTGSLQGPGVVFGDGEENETTLTGTGFYDAFVAEYSDSQSDGQAKLGAFSAGAWFLDLNGDFAFNAAVELLGWGSPTNVPVIGDWNGDGKDDMGVFANGTWFLDLNGNKAFDPATEVKGWGVAGWTPVVGDWNGDGKTDIGAVSPSSGWFLDLNGDFQFDAATEVVGWGSPGDIPVPSDWNGDGKTEIAVFSGGLWFIDFNGDRHFDPATEIKAWGQAGWTPILGDWNGDGATDLGVVTPNLVWFLDKNGDSAFDPGTEIAGWGSFGNTPVAADWNGDGKHEVAIYQGGQWFIDYNGNFLFDVATEIKGWGFPGALPVVGHW